MHLVDFLVFNEAKIRSAVDAGYEKAIEAIKITTDFIKSQQFFHYIRPDSAQGCFKIARQLSLRYCSRSMCSLATDGRYLYVRLP